MNEEIRKNLIDYYKWIVSIAIFEFTVTISFIGITQENSVKIQFVANISTFIPCSFYSPYITVCVPGVHRRELSFV